jgi:signal transduction histidine kinase
MADDIPVISPSERQIYGEFDRERSLRLARLVGLAFACLLMSVLFVMAALWLINPSLHSTSYLVMALTLGGSAALYVAASLLTRRRHMLSAASVVVASTVLVIAMFQATWESTHEVDLVVVAASGVYIIAVGLAGVLGPPRFLFGSTLLITIVLASVMLVVPHWISMATDDSRVLTATLIFSGVHWLAALLIYGSSTLYLQTLHELSAIRVAYERARQLDDLKDQFITNVNHELRTPAMAVQGYLDVLQLRHEVLAPERRGVIIAGAVRASADLVTLITSILDIQRLDQEATVFVPEAVDVGKAVAAAALRIAPGDDEVVERELRIRVPPGTEIWGEPVRLGEILTNLLTNAVKYSAPGTPVEVNATLIPSAATDGRGSPARSRARGEAMIEIVVRDYGLGIPPAQIPLLFERFVRLPRDLASSVVGNGLGLHLCRTLAEVMHGTIWVESSGVVGEGSAFHVRLPALSHAMPMEGNVRQAQKNPTPMYAGGR